VPPVTDTASLVARFIALRAPVGSGEFVPAVKRIASVLDSYVAHSLPFA
jgi:hypothetical protein